ncbi:glycoside hydrolase family 3 C-terminal domain-containing protein [Anaerocolumna aminovalerica]|uniref:Beta-glucosidase n=1 Tax=Anaerocolumna aminovalerica TaxID=1527 RepID=A0A1I5GKG8_9FIRM|nr:glycoside hydrolase family 3 C-terminal domain-containing protein [Anaerocolumna aminovalerica]SFO36462.1 beta-glucosidase [Anaerocolumna aminovalerica]
MNQIDNIMKKLTLEEKVSLCSGIGLWQTKDIEDKRIPAIWMADGSNGIRIMKPVHNQRKQDTSEFLQVTDLTQNSPTITKQYEAVCYPSGAALASTWNMELIESMGAMLGDECNFRKVNILLAPGINIKRSPLGGRGYEYYSEDPYLTGKTAEAFIKGVQSQGVGTSIKHFAANNAETLRINMSSDVDERALREIYLAPFELAIKNAKPWTVMSSYNKVNGVQMAENRRLLTDILRDEWNFDGVVVSDWGGIKDRVQALKAGNDLDMPENRRNNKSIQEAVENGTLDESVLDVSVRRILEMIFKAKAQERFKDSIDWESHREIAKKVAEDSIILLKNENNLLPITKEKYKKVAVIGAFATEPRYQGGGCTLVNPTRISNPYDEICRLAGNDIKITYAKGYEINNRINDQLLTEAVEKAGEADAAVIFAGLWVAYDREGFDRKTLDIDSSHIRLIQEICKIQKRVIVVLNNGDAVTMDPWINGAGAVVEQFLVGETVGEAVADILFGIVNPSGKLPVSFPKRLEDTSAYPLFPGECNHHIYGESIFVGYRYYEKKKIDTLFPFGFGLSYTEFAYSNLKLDKTVMNGIQKLTVQVTVANTGSCKGKEVVQLYVSDKESRLLRPIKELKKFEKIELEQGESKTVTFELSYRDFAYYDPEAEDWVVEDGIFDIHIGKSCEDIVLTASVEMKDAKKKFRYLYLDSQHARVFENTVSKKMYLDFLVEKGVLTKDNVDAMVPLLKGNYMGIYNVITSLLGGDITKEEMQEKLDEINQVCTAKSKAESCF